MADAAVHDWPLIIQESIGKGRGLFARRPILAGEVVLRESPCIITVTQDAFQDCCSDCFRWFKSDTKIPCPSCHQCFFCNDHCYESSILRKVHSPWICNALLSLSAKSILDSKTKTAIRWLLQVFNKSQNSTDLLPLKSTDEHPASTVDELLNLDKGSRPYADSILDTASKCFEFLMTFTPVDVSLVEDLTAVNGRNTFALMAPAKPKGQRAVRGHATYLKAAMFNHSCYPVAARFDYLDKEGDGNTDITFRMLRYCRQGREVAISYVPINWMLRDRQARLGEDYGFECQCHRCSLEASRPAEEEADSAGDDESEDDEEEEQEQEEEEEQEQEQEQDEYYIIEEIETDEDIENDYFSDSGEETDEDSVASETYLRCYLCAFHCVEEDCEGTLGPLERQFTNDQSLLAREETTVECNVCGHIPSFQDLYLRLNGDAINEFTASNVSTDN